MAIVLDRLGVAEGAMGTMLMAAGIDPVSELEPVNLAHGDEVERIHRLYAQAGATHCITNSFTICLSDDPGAVALAAKANAASVVLARRGNPCGCVLADVGPTSCVLEPMGQTPFDTAYRLYRRHIESLLAGGPDAILLETFTDISDLKCALLAAKDACGLPIVASCTFNESGRMPLSSTSPAAAARIAEALGASMVGLNCGIGPDAALGVLEEMSGATALPLIAQPNAGLPIAQPDGTTRYPGTPEEMASFAGRYRELGVAVYGSCCGSTPEFTRAIAVEFAGEPVAGHASPVERDASDEAAFWMASASECRRFAAEELASDEAVLGAGGLVVDCSRPLDPWDVLESIAEMPLVLASEHGFGGADELERLDTALKLYPGIAAVRVTGCPSADLMGIMGRYGAQAVCV